MIRQILAMTWKDLKILAKDPGGLSTLFLMPAAFIVIMSLALGGGYSSGDEPMRVLAVNQDAGRSGAAIIDGLKSSGGLKIETKWGGNALTQSKAEKLITDGERQVAVLIPSDYSKKATGGSFGGTAKKQQARIYLISDPALSAQVLGPIKASVAGVSQQTAMTSMVPQGIDMMFGYLEAKGAKIPAGERGKLKKDALRTGGVQGGSAVTIKETFPRGMKVEKMPNVVQQSVPGWALFGVFFIAPILAASIMDEKKLGTLKRLLAAPAPRAVLLLGKLKPYFIVNLIQIMLMFVVGAFLMPVFGTPRLELGTHPEALVVISIAASLAATGMGLLLAAILKTQEQVGGVGSLLAVVLAAIGGVMVPRIVMPQYMRDIGLISPHAWGLDAHQDVLLRGYGIAQVMPKVGALLAFAVAFFAIALLRFKWE